MLFKKFAKFVNEQPAKRAISHHLFGKTTASWSVCSVGDFCRECLQINEDAISIVGELCADEKTTSLTKECNVMTALSHVSRVVVAPNTYGELQWLIAEHHPQLS